jgi:hypothetical protein
VEDSCWVFARFGGNSRPDSIASMSHYRILINSDLDVSKVKKSYEKVVAFLEQGNFAAADVKKMQDTGYYRAKLDDANRLLFSFGRFDGQTCLFLVEVILNHDYANSKYLNGAVVDEAKLTPLHAIDAKAEKDFAQLAYLNPRKSTFHLLDRILSFDDVQSEVFETRAPLVIIGSAGSGKTVLTLSKMRMLHGNILYVTHSPYLIENASKLYYAHQYENSNQNIDFLSFKEFVQTLKVPEGTELDFRKFDQWFARHKQASPIKDSHKLYEEFKGVLTGASLEKPWLELEDYRKLGVKQSIFLAEEREQVYAIFQKFLTFLSEENYYDLNIIAWNWRQLCHAHYDFVVVDEVQDFTNVQLDLVLRMLKNSQSFILSGDSNQIVHPNFFSWAGLRGLFYARAQEGKIARVLESNYRNAPQITALANRLLKVKQLRFGSIDRESNYLVKSVATTEGRVEFLENDPKLVNELNQKTKQSAKYAVVVMRDEDKETARKQFQTPLVFSVREAKGLEYPNVILYNFLSGNEKEFREIAQEVDLEEVEQLDELQYARGKDKTNKSLEAYKFYVNSLYVAITRAMENVYLIERTQKHEILRLLGLVETKRQLRISQEQSSLEEWKAEARRLELQGKAEQASQIRTQILGVVKPDWVPLTHETLPEVRAMALIPESFNKKSKDLLFAYALIYNEKDVFAELVKLKYRRAENPAQERKNLVLKYYREYQNDDLATVTRNVTKFGVDFRDQFNKTPLIAAVESGAVNIAKYLFNLGANPALVDNVGRSPFRIALSQAFENTIYRDKFLTQFAQMFMDENIKVKINDSLVKIDHRKAEYFILNFLIALQSKLIEQRKGYESKAVSMDDLETSFAKYPDTILPAHRKKRSYINSILAKNEVEKEDDQTKRLFLRLNRGYYVLNPEMEILIDEQWTNVYELMQQEPMTRERNSQLVDEEMEEWRKQRDEERRKRQQQRAGFSSWKDLMKW